MTDGNELRIDELIEITRGYKMSDAEREKQRRSFAWGNVAIGNPEVTRNMIDEVVDGMPRYGVD